MYWSRCSRLDGACCFHRTTLWERCRLLKAIGWWESCSFHKWRESECHSLLFFSAFCSVVLSHVSSGMSILECEQLQLVACIRKQRERLVVEYTVQYSTVDYA